MSEYRKIDWSDSFVSRAQIISNARTLRAEIKQIFLDCAAWNEHSRGSDDEPIDPDPDGQLTRIASGLDAMLAKEL